MLRLGFLLPVVLLLAAPSAFALAASHHPVILVPGLAGSQVRAQLKDSSPPHSLCEKTSAPGKWLQLWLSLEEVAPYAKDCLLSRIALTFDNATGAYSDAPGVTLDTNVDFGNVSGVAALDPAFPKESGYFLPLITFLEQELGYVAGADLHGAPYDWRLAPDGHSAPGQYYDKVKKLVEQTFSRNGNRSVHFVTHSLGGPTVLGFLNTMTQPWKDTYIASFAPISGPFGGSVAQANAFVAGDTLGVPLIPHDYLRPIQITAASGSFMMATTEAFGSERVFVSTPARNYTSRDWEAFLSDLGHTQALGIWQTMNAKHVNMAQQRAPGVATHSITSHGVPTLEHLVYPDALTKGYEKVATSQGTGDGDGTVNLESLQVPGRFWAAQQGGHPLTLFNVSGVSHYGMISNKDVFAYIKDKVLGM